MSVFSCEICKDPPKLTFPAVLLSQSVPILVVIAPLTVTVPPFANVTFASVPEAGPVILVKLMFPETENKVKVCAAAIVTAPAFRLEPKRTVLLFAKLEVRDEPKSMAPLLRISPPMVLIPDPLKVMESNAWLDPIATVLIVPLPALIVKPKALFTSPRVTFPLPELVVMVRSAENPVVRELPFKSTLPLVIMLPPKVLLPVPCKVRLVSGVPAPIAPSVIEPLPLLTVKPNAPSSVKAVWPRVGSN